MANDTARGRFVWYELVTPSSDGAHEFYSRVLGWRRESLEADPSYSMFAGPNGPLGGVFESHDDTPYWVPYVLVPDVRETLRQAMDLGGTVTTGATELPNGGVHAALTDPQGGLVGIYSSGGEHEQDREPNHGEFSWHELATTDYAAAFEFYSALFGWERIAEHDMGAMGIYLIFGWNGRQVGGFYNRDNSGKAGPAYWINYVRVENLRDTVKEAEADRGLIVNGPMEVPGGDWVAQLRDPYGALFALHTVAADLEAPRSVSAPKRSDAAGADAQTSEERQARPARKKTKKKAKKKAKKKVSAKKAGKKAASKKAAKTKASKKTGGKKATRKKATRKKATRKKATKKKAAKKKAAKKKVAKKKVAKKKVARKKAARKKTVKKKAGGKKAGTRKAPGKTSKKKASKKKPSKKTAKKTAKKKPSKKKASKKKAGKKAGKKSGGKKSAAKKASRRKAGTGGTAAKKRTAAGARKGAKRKKAKRS